MTRDQALAELALDDRELAEDEVRQAHRRRAATAHPDAGGTDVEMALVNEARDLLLSELECVCRGFTRNKLCRAKHEDDVKKVEVSTEGVGQCVCRGLIRNPLCRAHDTKG